MVDNRRNNEAGAPTTGRRPIVLGQPEHIDFPGPVDDGPHIPAEPGSTPPAQEPERPRDEDDMLVRALRRDDNARAVLMAAFIRGAYSAFGMFAVTFVGALLMDVDNAKAILTAIVAALATLGFRGAVEGKMDAERAKSGDVKQSDVGAAG